MSKKSYKAPVSREHKAHVQSGLSSLLWMFVGALIAVMIGVFVYLSPLFNSFRTEVDVNPEMVVTPKAQPTESGEYEFYEVLPTREFQGGDRLSKDAPDTPTVKDRVDAVVNVPEESTASGDSSTDTPTKPTPTGTIVQRSGSRSTEPSAEPAQPTKTTKTQDVVAVVEENATYDEPSQSIDKGSKFSTQRTQPTVNKSDNNKIANVSSVRNTYFLQIRSYDNAADADRMRADVMIAGVDAKIIKSTNDNGELLYQVVSTPTHSREEVIRASQRLSDNGIDSLVVERR